MSIEKELAALLSESFPAPAEGGYLDRLAAIFAISREVYGYDHSNKPNPYCIWSQISYTVWAWEENDDHFRERILKLTGEQND